MRLKFLKTGLVVVALTGLMFVAACGERSSQPVVTPAGNGTTEVKATPTEAAVNTQSPEAKATDAPTPEPKATDTPTPEPTATNTPTPEPTATNTPTPTPEVSVRQAGDGVNSTIYLLNSNYYTYYDEATSKFVLMSTKGEKVDFRDFALEKYQLQDGAFAVKHDGDNFCTLYDRDLKKICDTSKYPEEGVYSYSDDMLCLEFKYVEDGYDMGNGLRMLDGRKGFAEAPRNGKIRPSAFWTSAGASGFYNNYLVTSEGMPCVIIYDREGNQVKYDDSQVYEMIRSYSYIDQDGWMMVHCVDDDSWEVFSVGFWNIKDGTYLKIPSEYVAWKLGSLGEITTNNYAVLSFDDGEDRLYGLYSLDKNNFVTPKKYQSINVRDLVNKYALISDAEGKWGYLNMDDYSEVFAYDDVGSFSKGYAVAVKDGRAIVINQNLEEVAELCNDAASSATLMCIDQTDKIFCRIKTADGLNVLYEVIQNK